MRCFELVIAAIVVALLATLIAPVRTPFDSVANAIGHVGASTQTVHP